MSTVALTHYHDRTHFVSLPIERRSSFDTLNSVSDSLRKARVNGGQPALYRTGRVRAFVERVSKCTLSTQITGQHEASNSCLSSG